MIDRLHSSEKGRSEGCRIKTKDFSEEDFSKPGKTVGRITFEDVLKNKEVGESCG